MLTWPENKAEMSASTSLSDRLSVIAESLPRGGVICDVGSDHGALPLFLLQNNWCRRAVVTDLNELPLKRAKLNLKNNGVDHLADFVLTDGISDVLSYGADAYVIAGMGGETIAGILSRALDRIPKQTVFVLQPMTKEIFLRRYLYEHGFRMESEVAVEENGKTFLVFCAVFDGVIRSHDDDFYFVGEFLSRLRSKAACSYLKKNLMKIKSKIDGKKKAGLSVLSEEREKMAYLAALEVKDEHS